MTKRVSRTELGLYPVAPSSQTAAPDHSLETGPHRRRFRNWVHGCCALIISLGGGPCSCLIHCGGPSGAAGHWCGSLAGWCRTVYTVNARREDRSTVALVPLPGRVRPT